MRGTRRSGVIGAGLSSLVLLSGCAGDGPSLPKLANLNPFAEKAVPLPGKRISIMQPRRAGDGRVGRRQRADHPAGAARQRRLGAGRR